MTLSQFRPAAAAAFSHVRRLSTGMPPPLKGVRILDLTRVLAGPTATMLLGDLGADVIKVEEATRGDDTRSWSPPSAPLLDADPAVHSSGNPLPPESAYFLSSNRNKRSLTLNLKTKRGLEVAHQLVKTSDILVENFLPGTLERLGLGYNKCSELTDGKIIYASISGYGQTGPFATAAGYDVVIEGEAGLMHITGEPDRPPSKVGVAATDIATGLYTHGAVMAALISRSQTGKGVWIDCNLFESQVAGLANIASNYLIAGQEAGRHGTAHPSIVPYQVFPCRDGFLMVGAGNDRQFQTLANTILDRPDLAEDARFKTNGLRVKNRVTLVAEICKTLEQEGRDVWLERFKGKGVPFGPINNISQTFQHPQALSRGVTVEVEHPRAGPIKLVAPAVSYNGERMPIQRPPPWLGQHTEEILGELGYNRQDVEQMRQEGVV